MIRRGENYSRPKIKAKTYKYFFLLLYMRLCPRKIYIRRKKMVMHHVRLLLRRALSTQTYALTLQCSYRMCSVMPRKRSTGRQTSNRLDEMFRCPACRVHLAPRQVAIVSLPKYDDVPGNAEAETPTVVVYLPAVLLRERSLLRRVRPSNATSRKYACQAQRWRFLAPVGMCTMTVGVRDLCGAADLLL